MNTRFQRENRRRRIRWEIVIHGGGRGSWSLEGNDLGLRSDKYKLYKDHADTASVQSGVLLVDVVG